jgi:hypothetical protein
VKTVGVMNYMPGRRQLGAVTGGKQGRSWLRASEGTCWTATEKIAKGTELLAKLNDKIAEIFRETKDVKADSQPQNESRA